MTKDKVAKWLRSHDDEIMLATFVGIGLCALSLTAVAHKSVKLQKEALKDTGDFFPKHWTFPHHRMTAMQTDPKNLFLTPFPSTI